MRKTTVIITLALFFGGELTAQTVDFIWAKSFGATMADAGFSTTTDDSGNVYTSGYFNDTVDFDPSGATFNLISNGQADILIQKLDANGDYDVFIQKLDANGNFLWAKSVGGGPFGDHASSIATDVSGNAYVTGFYRGTVDFDPGSATFNLNSNTN